MTPNSRIYDSLFTFCFNPVAEIRHKICQNFVNLNCKNLETTLAFIVLLGKFSTLEMANYLKSTYLVTLVTEQEDCQFEYHYGPLDHYDALRPIQTGRIKCSGIGQFNVRVKRGQLENSLSYCILRSELCWSERAFSSVLY